jgi:hypothetical protein
MFSIRKKIITDFDGFNMHTDINSKMLYWKIMKTVVSLSDCVEYIS